MSSPLNHLRLKSRRDALAYLRRTPPPSCTISVMASPSKLAADEASAVNPVAEAGTAFSDYAGDETTGDREQPTDAAGEPETMESNAQAEPQGGGASVEPKETSTDSTNDTNEVQYLEEPSQDADTSRVSGQVTKEEDSAIASIGIGREDSVNGSSNVVESAVQLDSPQGEAKRESRSGQAEEDTDDYAPPEASENKEAQTLTSQTTIEGSEDNNKNPAVQEAGSFAVSEPIEETSSSEEDVDHMAILREHPITVAMGPESYPLVGDDGLYTNYPEHALTLEDVFGAVRDRTPELPLDKELVFAVNPLGLRVSEDNLYTREVNTTDMIKLLATQPTDSQLVFEVSTEERFITKLNHLYEILADELDSKPSVSDPKRRKIES